MYVCMYVCMYVYIYIYIWRRGPEFGPLPSPTVDIYFYKIMCAASLKL